MTDIALMGYHNWLKLLDLDARKEEISQRAAELQLKSDSLKKRVCIDGEYAVEEYNAVVKEYEKLKKDLEELSRQYDIVDKFIKDTWTPWYEKTCGGQRQTLQEFIALSLGN